MLTVDLDRNGFTYSVSSDLLIARVLLDYPESSALGQAGEGKGKKRVRLASDLIQVTVPHSSSQRGVFGGRRKDRGRGGRVTLNAIFENCIAATEMLGLFGVVLCSTQIDQVEVNTGNNRAAQVRAAQIGFANLFGRFEVGCTTGQRGKLITNAKQGLAHRVQRPSSRQ